MTKTSQPESDGSTPGRPKESGTRQQTHDDQVEQTGSAQTDKDFARGPRSAERRSTRSQPDHAEDLSSEESNYHDRPTDDGKFGDGVQEPTPRPI